MKLILTAFCVTGIIGQLVLVSYVFLFSSEILLVLLELVGECFYVVFFSSFHLDFSLVALHTPSCLLLCNPLSYKCHFPIKTSTSLCLQVLCSFSLKLCHLCELVLNMHFCLFCSYSLLNFLSIYLQLYRPYVCLMVSSHLDKHWSFDVTLSTFGVCSKIKSVGRRGLYPNNEWYTEYPVELCFMQL